MGKRSTTKHRKRDRNKVRNLSEIDILSEVEYILDVIDLREKLDSQSLLKSITNKLVSAKQKDKSTLIYRIAMTIYHSSKYWINNCYE